MSHSLHHHFDPDAGDRRVLLAVVVNLGLTVAQVVGGILSGSLALIADALHNFFGRDLAYHRIRCPKDRAEVGRCDDDLRLRPSRGGRGAHQLHDTNSRRAPPCLRGGAAFHRAAGIDKGAWDRADAIKAKVKRALHDEFGIEHTTIEMECAAHACTDTAAIGH